MVNNNMLYTCRLSDRGPLNIIFLKNKTNLSKLQSLLWSVFIFYFFD